MLTSKLFYVNGANRTYGTSSDFTYLLDFKSVEGATHIQMMKMYIPKSFYSIQVPYNTFFLTENDNQVEIAIPEGNYTLASIKTKLKALLDAGSPNGWVYTVGSSNTLTEPETGKLVFSVSGNMGVQPEISIPYNSSMGKVMGFSAGSANDFMDDELVSSNVIDLQPEGTLFLHSDIVSNGSDNILQEVFTINEMGFSGIIYESYNDDYAKRLATKTNNSYRFYLTDENNIPINLNGLDIVFTVRVFKKINYFTIIQSFFDLMKSR